MAKRTNVKAHSRRTTSGKVARVPQHTRRTYRHKIVDQRTGRVKGFASTKALDELFSHKEARRINDE